MQEETPDLSRRRDAEALLDLARCRYALPVLAELFTRSGAKGVTLARAAGAAPAQPSHTIIYLSNPLIGARGIHL